LPRAHPAGEVVPDTEEGHPGRTGVLSDERNDTALAASDVALVAADQRLVAHDRRGDAALLPSPGAGDHCHLPDPGSRMVIPAGASAKQAVVIE
jgi:hypothetical protein